MRRKEELLIGEWAVLALLCERPAHGYAVAAAMAPQGDLGQIWSLGQPLTYRTLQVLKSWGLVEVAAIKPGDQAPQRTEFQATTNAKRMVTRWLATPEPHVRDMRSSLLLKIHLLHRRGRSPLKLLTAQRELLVSQADALGTPAAGETDPHALLRRWRLTMTQAALDFVDDTLDREASSQAVPT